MDRLKCDRLSEILFKVAKKAAEYDKNERQLAVDLHEMLIDTAEDMHMGYFEVCRLALDFDQMHELADLELELDPNDDYLKSLLKPKE